MLEFLKKQLNRTYTENGAVTNVTTYSHCLDLFATVGALRRESDEEIICRFLRAYTEDPDLAMKILFFARDIRVGLGERRVFRTVLVWLAHNAPQSVARNVPYIAEYGRWDDLLPLLDTPCRQAAADCIAAQFWADLRALETGGEVSLLGKWLPSVNASNADTVRQAKDLARNVLHLRDREYRQALTRLRAHIRILENHLRERDYTFDYSKQPSKAMFKYRKAFARNDGERYGAFLGRVQKGTATLHASTLMPYELVAPYLQPYWNGKTLVRAMSAAEEHTLNATWASLPDFGTDENALAVIDTSGSMYMAGAPLPAAVALSLGLYFAEHSKGMFANHFIEFSDQPQLIELKGRTFVEKLRYIASFNRVANTNLEAVFDLLLRTAVRYHLPQSELPAKLYLISDMEFDRCVSGAQMTNFESARRKFRAHGYDLPQIVFWNVASRNQQQPVTVNDRGVALVSGCTPRIFSMALQGELDPMGYMMQIIGSERYAPIAA